MSVTRVGWFAASSLALALALPAGASRIRTEDLTPPPFEERFALVKERCSSADRRLSGALGVRSTCAILAGAPSNSSREALVDLEPAEYEQATRRFGAFYPYEIGLLLRDPAGRRVYLEWDAHWVGGHEYLELKDGGWELLDVEQWIT